MNDANLKNGIEELEARSKALAYHITYLKKMVHFYSLAKCGFPKDSTSVKDGINEALQEWFEAEMDHKDGQAQLESNSKVAKKEFAEVSRILAYMDTTPICNVCDPKCLSCLPGTYCHSKEKFTRIYRCGEFGKTLSFCKCDECRKKKPAEEEEANVNSEAAEEAAMTRTLTKTRNIQLAPH